MFFFRRSIPLLMLIALAGGVTGCAKKEEPKPAEPPPPPPPTPEQISAKIIQDAGINAPLPGPDDGYSRADADKLKGVLRGAASSNAATPEGKRAMQIVNQQFEQRLRALENAKAWEHLLGGIEAYEAINPGSPKWGTSKETAIAELKKPKITLVGFMQGHAIMDFYLPITKDSQRLKMQVGEELLGITFVEIIGNNQGVRLRYRETGQSFDVFTKTAQKTQ